MNKTVFCVCNDRSLKGRTASVIDGWLEHALPLVKCPMCRPRSGDCDLYLPALKLPPSLAAIATRSYKIISPEEFVHVREEVQRYNQTNQEILPGCPIGAFEGTLQSIQMKACYDFLFAVDWCPLIRKTAAQKLKDAGIDLVLGPAVLQLRKHQIHEYAAIHVEAVNLLSEQTMTELTLKQCPGCGVFRKTKLGTSVQGPWKLMRQNWPAGQHLLRIREHNTYIIPSVEFMTAVQQLRLTGIVFKEFGEWI